MSKYTSEQIESMASRCGFNGVTPDVSDMLRTLSAEIQRNAEDASAKDKCLSFFRSVILSGEAWSPTCQQMYDAAMQANNAEVKDGR